MFFGSYRMAKRIWASVRYAELYRKFSSYTMIPRSEFMVNLELVSRYSGIKGAFVECGTWKGGMSAAAARILGTNRQYCLCDSFEGLPPAKDIDGISAKEWQENINSGDYFDNCSASVSDVYEAMNLAGIREPVVHKGWFRDTLPKLKCEDNIAILRADADWYESTYDVFNHLARHVNPGGLIIVDDYYKWDGCARAVHDFLSHSKCTWRIRTYRRICYIEVDDSIFKHSGN